jgi:hypothetical protein
MGIVVCMIQLRISAVINESSLYLIKNIRGVYLLTHKQAAGRIQNSIEYMPFSLFDRFRCFNELTRLELRLRILPRAAADAALTY